MAWETKTKIGSLPLISIGSDPLGVIAIGGSGAGIIYIGWIGGGIISITQLGVGFICISQMGVGVFTLGQLAVGIFSMGQLALGLVYALGQGAVGFISVGYGSSCGYYDIIGKGTFLSDINRSLQLVKEYPQPLFYWSLIWGLLIAFVAINWEKLRYGWTFLDFFRPIYRHSRFKARLEAVEELEDQEDLENMARYDPHPRVQIAAVKKIKSPDVLLEIATGKSKSSVRLAAIERISDEILLGEVVRGSGPEKVKLAAIRKIEGEDLLLQLFKGASDTAIKSEIIGRINDDKKLAEAGEAENDRKLKKVITTRVAGQGVLTALVLREADPKVIGNIMRRITDRERLANIALNAESERARILAVKRITDYTILVKIKDGERSQKVKRAAETILKKFRPRYSYISVKLDCPNCGQPVFPGGPLLNPECSYCLKKFRIKKEFWLEIFSEPFIPGSYSMLGGDFSNISVEKGEKYPCCLKCGKKLTIPDGKVGSSHTVSCPSCSFGNPSYPLPGWMEDIKKLRNKKSESGDPRQLYCTLQEGVSQVESMGDIKPVAVTCVQCGGTLKITVETPRNAVCPYCDTSQYLPDPLWRILHPVSQKHPWYIRWSSYLRK